MGLAVSWPTDNQRYRARKHYLGPVQSLLQRAAGCRRGCLNPGESIMDSVIILTMIGAFIVECLLAHRLQEQIHDWLNGHRA
jgi:hypothetical protein